MMKFMIKKKNKMLKFEKINIINANEYELHIVQ